VNRSSLLCSLLLASSALGFSSRAVAQPAPAPPPAGEGKLATQLEEQQADINAQDARIRDLEKKLADLSKQLAERKEPPPAAPAPAAPKAPAVSTADASAAAAKTDDPLAGIRLRAYVQGQYERHQDSEDQLRQGGALLNQNKFVLRRARLKLERDWQYAAVMVEIDGNSVRGPAISVQHAEASLLYRGKGETSGPPLVKGTLGLFDTPFGYELVESPRERYFAERTIANRAFFPGEPDVGARVSGQLGWLRYAAAIVNGEPKDERSGFSLQDPNGDKDFVARLGAQLTAGTGIEISGGVSVLNGTGFHKGTDATKNSVVWKDANENGQVDVGELTAVPGTAATVAQNFDRWAMGADYELTLRTPLGRTQLAGEVVVASNMDRGLYVADPILNGVDTREVAYYVGLTQEVTRYAVVGFRYESYDPNADYLDRQGGKVVPSSTSIRAYSPMVGLVLPDRARLIFQYDILRDHLARDRAGVPTDLENDAWTLRLQVSL